MMWSTLAEAWHALDRPAICLRLLGRAGGVDLGDLPAALEQSRALGLA